MKKSIFMGALIGCVAAISGCGESSNKSPDGIDLKIHTDSLFAIMKSNRTNYAKLVVERLGPDGINAISPVEHWKDLENGTPLPAQMFRAGAEGVGKLTDNFTYSLQSIWPINSQNAPRTPMEREGLEFVREKPGENFYGKETLGDTTYFTAVYPDVGVTDACITCHNEHKDSPRTDFVIGEVMGGVVIRVPLKN